MVLPTSVLFSFKKGYMYVCLHSHKMCVGVIDKTLFLSFLLSSGRAGFMLQEIPPLLCETPHNCVLAISLLTSAHVPGNTSCIFPLDKLPTRFGKAC